jgi:hypothetical protein
MLATASLELKAEKENAHSAPVAFVAFSHDGATFVTGSWDKTIKVWDAGVSALTPSNPYHPLLKHVLLCGPTQTLCSSSRNARATAARSMRRGQVRSHSATARPCASRRAVASSTRLAHSRASRRTGPGSSRARSRASCTTQRCRGEWGPHPIAVWCSCAWFAGLTPCVCYWSFC